MSDVPARALLLACAIVTASYASGKPVTFEPCDELPAAVLALGGAGEPEAFGVATGVAVASFASPTETGRSVLKFARGADEPRSVPLAGRVLGLTVSGDGTVVFAIVRVIDRKGAVRSVELARVDLRTGKDSLGASLPTSARGCAFGSDGTTLLVAAGDEIRTFQLPSLASGPLYRVLGENVGVVPVGRSSHIFVAQPTRVVRADLAGTQGRDGLPLADEAISPGPLTGLMASTGERGPRVLGAGGRRWCLLGGAPPDPPPAAAAAVAAEPEPNPPVAETVVPPEPSPLPPPPSPAPWAAPESPGQPAESGTITGKVEGPSLGDVAAVVVLGPDNILKEAARGVPDADGRFSVSGLAAGAYRIVAAGKGGRVLICDPAFITVHVGGNGAVEAPVMKVLHAP